jgi:DNA-binding NtrC family response regulator
MGARAATETLLMWASVGSGPTVLCDVLRLLRAKRARVGRVLYLMQAEDMPLPPKADLGDVELEKVHVPLSDPTHHKVIHEALRARVLPRLRALDGALHINVSAGTPAMHAVWLVLHAGGAFPEGARLWSAQRPKNNESRIDPVEFPIRTYLAEIRRAAAANPSEAQYDPDCRSPARRRALETLARYARLPRAPLLLLGERGTGKTRLVETFVGHLKGRSNVVTVPCGTLEPNLAMSLLFGHVKGAFTGADKDHAGFLTQAEGGVLFLDEVQDLEARVQRQLVRVLQDPKRRFRPVGGDEEEANAEIVCASHLSLEALRARLDVDLFDRVSLLLVEVPPLRQCREDLREDWQRVWREARSYEDLPQDAPWSGAMTQALGKSPLSGNLRDLQRLALILMARAEGGTGGRWIEEGLAEWQALQARFEAVEREEMQGEGDLGTGTWNERVETFKQRLARAAHREYGSYVAAAKALAVSERALREHAKGEKE